MKTQEQAVSLNPTERALLNEVVEWAGKFLLALAALYEAERLGDEDAFDTAWGDAATALFLLKEKAQQAHELLDAN
ncbi:MAG: hypothetical protein RMJ90_05475 [Candidatus Bipolaricaulota bacterium]|nr:hypothetical protein [Candidatus Bipolaricaulota bacterium]